MIRPDSGQRVDFLLATQNSDGGWGYLPGRYSWLEPTAWAYLALRGKPGTSPACERAWTMLRALQMKDGSCRPCREVDAPTWATSLWVTAHCVRGVRDEFLEKAVAWLVDSRGAEGSLWRRTLRALAGIKDEFNAEWCGWAWWPGTSSWIEPTVHTIIALRKARAAGAGGSRVLERIEDGERMLLDRRCRDGGWNYGVRGDPATPMLSYPETTGLALVALAGHPDPSVQAVARRAASLHSRTRHDLGRTWLKVALRAWRIPVSDHQPHRFRPDVLQAALELIGMEEGNWPMFNEQDNK